ncbi:MAG: NAD(P)/FAD-dependent oxidoreductase, partial [Pseudomonadota bacterium]
CDKYGVRAKRVGKLVVADDDQIPALRALHNRARGNGVDDVRWLDALQVKTMEPALRCAAALYSPSTGIVDSHAFMLSLHGELERHGAQVVLRTPVLSGHVQPKGLVIETGGDAPATLHADWVINAAGLDAVDLAQRLGRPVTEPLRYAKGNYFDLTTPAPFSHLIYPVPEPGGLGIHLTLDLAGRARFGPDVEWVTERDYNVDPARAKRFYTAIQRYWPEIPDDSLQPAYAGLRPKLVGPGDDPADFVVEGPESHGVRGLINLLGIESPGLTASLALADHVVGCIESASR